MKLKEVISLELQKDIYLVEEAEGHFTFNFQSRSNLIHNFLFQYLKILESHTLSLLNLIN